MALEAEYNLPITCRFYGNFFPCIQELLLRNSMLARYAVVVCSSVYLSQAGTVPLPL